MMEEKVLKVDFTGKTVIVTGGSKGIGEGCARAFCDAGANVVICARDAKDGQAKADELCATYGEGRCVFIQCDVSDYSQIKNVVDKTVEIYGRIDCLMNNAGFHPPYEFIDDVTPEMFEIVLRTNLVSMFAFCKYALPHLRKVKGSIVNMSSMVGEIGQKQSARYVSSKAGIMGLTKALAVDEGRTGVRVNCVAPGCITTPLGAVVAEASGDAAQEVRLATGCSVMTRAGTVDETAAACVFLASEMASFLTGVVVPVTGGAELAYGIKPIE